MKPEEELQQYVGMPRCQDCKWKLGTPITDNCFCQGTKVDHEKHEQAFNRARELQRLVAETERGIK